MPQNIGFLFTFQHFVEGQTVRERKTQQIKKQQKTNFLSKPILRRKKKLTAELLSFLRFYEAQILGLEPFLIWYQARACLSLYKTIQFTYITYSNL